MSIDGKIAMQNGESKWITSKAARQDVQKFRAKSSVIMSSSNTILTDNPCLNVRYKELDEITRSIFPKKYFNNPIRVIIDSQNRIMPSHNIINTHGPVWLIRLKKDKNRWPENTKQIILNNQNNKINILSLFQFLGKQKINNVWIETGSMLSGFLLENNLVDELVLYIAPKILGHEARSLCILQKKIELFNSLKFDFKKIKKIGSNIRIILTPKK